MVQCVSFSPDGKMLASTGEDKTIKLWDLSTEREIRSFRDTRSPFSLSPGVPMGNYWQRRLGQDNKTMDPSQEKRWLRCGP